MNEEKKKKGKKGVSTSVILLIIFLAGLSLVLYPTVSDYINSMNQTKAITGYAEKVASISEEDYTSLWSSAEDFNKQILKRDNPLVLPDKDVARYYELLDITGNGVMGYIEIPTIEVSLPVYHGTSNQVLSKAVGHLEWTSLPVGGASTHAVLSGHRGLPSAKLFTHLDKLVEGDIFMLRVLDEVLTYEVDQILIVEPSDIEALQITPGKDFCTLVTCTPYGINTHRLLIRGHRIDNQEEAAVIMHVTAEAVQIEPAVIAGIIGVPFLVLMIMVASLIGFPKSRRKKKKGDYFHA